MDAWQPVVFFDDEDPEALKAAFVRLCAKHKNNFTAVEVAKYIFSGLREPEIRALQAAKAWGEDLEVQESIRLLLLHGDDSQSISKDELSRRLLAIADDFKENAKDRIDAIRTVAQIQGMIVKPIELKTGDGKGGGLPTFQIVQYADEAD